MRTAPEVARSDEEKREDQLTTAPKSSAKDAKPRIVVTEKADQVKRVNIREDANARPGKPG